MSSSVPPARKKLIVRKPAPKPESSSGSSLSEPRRSSSTSHGTIGEGQEEGLPANPKHWRPAQLAHYLSTTFDTFPSRIVEDLTAFVRQSGLTGKAFVRLTENDLEEMGINVRWRPMLLDAKERLRRERLASNIMWNVAGPSTTTTTHAGSVGQNDQANEEAEDEKEEEADKENWVQSWRETTGKKSRGAVKGLASRFEHGHGSDLQSDSSSSHQSFETANTSSSNLSAASQDTVCRVATKLSDTPTTDEDEYYPADLQEGAIARNEAVLMIEAIEHPDSVIVLHRDEVQAMQKRIESLEAQVKRLEKASNGQEQGGKEEQRIVPHTWTALGSWTVLATVGIGIVVSEAMLSKIVRTIMIGRSPLRGAAP